MRENCMEKLFTSCFIFNLIAIEDKAQIQTFQHIKKSSSFRCCVYRSHGGGRKISSFFHPVENSPEILRYKLDKHLFNL